MKYGILALVTFLTTLFSMVGLCKLTDVPVNMFLVFVGSGIISIVVTAFAVENKDE